LNELWIIFALVFVAALLGVQGLFLFFSTRRREQKSVNRRLLLTKQLANPTAVLEALRRERGFANFENRLLRGANDFLTQTGLKLNYQILSLAPIGLSLIFFLFAGIMLGPGLIALAIAVLAAGLTVLLFLGMVRARRIARFAEQLPDAIEVIVRGVRVGYPVSSALGLVAREMPDPIGSEFGMTSDEISFGSDIKTAIENLYRRVGQEDLMFLVISINVQSQTGGNLAEILSRLAGLIRSRARLRLKIRALTSEGRLSAVFLSVIPLALIVTIVLLVPKYFSVALGHPFFVPAVVFGVSSMLLGNLIIYRMVNFKF
jgi:tight adherence protein B